MDQNLPQRIQTGVSAVSTTFFRGGAYRSDVSLIRGVRDRTLRSRCRSSLQERTGVGNVWQMVGMSGFVPCYFASLRRSAITFPWTRLLMKPLLLLLLTSAVSAQKLADWVRPTDAPVITPKPTSVFFDPITKEQVHWEALHTFNPAAVLRNGRVLVLYRAEDDSGADAIGMYVSRLGFGNLPDGIHFTRLPEPVFFAADDAQSSREVPGGVEDPRIVEAPDGSYILTYTQWSRKRSTYSIGIATSTDLKPVEFLGPAFGGWQANTGGSFTNLRESSRSV